MLQLQNIHWLSVNACGWLLFWSCRCSTSPRHGTLLSETTRRGGAEQIAGVHKLLFMRRQKCAFTFRHSSNGGVNLRASTRGETSERNRPITYCAVLVGGAAGVKTIESLSVQTGCAKWFALVLLLQCLHLPSSLHSLALYPVHCNALYCSSVRTGLCSIRGWRRDQRAEKTNGSPGLCWRCQRKYRA